MNILIVEDRDDDRDAFEKVLGAAGHEIIPFANAEDALSQSEETIRSLDFAILDWQLPRMTGLELGQALFYKNPRLFLIMVTAYGTVEKELEARRYGGFIHFISKPGLEEVRDIITLLEPEVQERRTLFGSLGGAKYGIVGRSLKVLQVRELIATVAPTDARALILGESGTGKELVANALHGSSRRQMEPYIRINCAAIPETLLESELFGHEKGAFTGALKQKPGRVEEAAGGTIFLDEIADMSRPLQAKLLRFLEDGTFSRVGGIQELHVNVRLVAATNRDIAKAIAEDQFREDLFYRLNVVQFRLPPLRERGDDVLLLAQHFLNHFNKTMKKKFHGFSKAAQQGLLNHNWPGNVRELRNAIERAVLVEETNTISPKSLPDLATTDHGASYAAKTHRSAACPSQDTRTPYWKTLIAEKLDWLESAFAEALKNVQDREQEDDKKKVRQVDLAEVLKCSHPTVGVVFRDTEKWNDIPGPERIEIIRGLSEEFPQRWPGLRGSHSRLAKYFHS
jgi:DNA-binding NtrC family response regulator